jgi:hypothetical protein
MATFFKQIKDSLSWLWIYSLCFLVVFNFIFLPRFANSGETFGMYIIASFFLQLLTFILFPLAIVTLNKIISQVNPIAKAIVLFLSFEVVLLLFIGNVSLFGLFETPTPNVTRDLQSDLLTFHKNRDFGLSISSLTSVVVYFFTTIISKKLHQPPLTQDL